MFNPYTFQGGTATMESPTPSTNGQSRAPDFFGSTMPQNFVPTNPVTGTPMYNPMMQYPTYPQQFLGGVNPAFCGVPNYGVPNYGVPGYGIPNYGIPTVGYQNFAPTTPFNTFAPGFAGHQVNPFWQNPYVNNPYAAFGSVPTFGVPNAFGHTMPGYPTPFATPNFATTPWNTVNPFINPTVNPYVGHQFNPYASTPVNPFINPAINPFVSSSAFAPTIPGYIPSPITPGFFRAPVVANPYAAVSAGIPTSPFHNPIASALLGSSIYSNLLSPFFANPQAFAMTNPAAQIGTIAALNNLASVCGSVSPFGVNPITALQSGVLGNDWLSSTLNPLTSPIAALSHTAATTPWLGLNNPGNTLGLSSILNNPIALASILGGITNPHSFSSPFNTSRPWNTGVGGFGGFGGVGSPFGLNPILANSLNVPQVNPACWTGCCL
jgi:hypothetical protein